MDVVSVSGPVRSPRCPCRTVLADSEPSRAAAVMSWSRRQGCVRAAAVGCVVHRTAAVVMVALTRTAVTGTPG